MLNRINFLTGLFLGLVVCLYVCMVGYGYVWAIVWLKEWQTLLTGLLATIAAVSTVFAIREQIQQTENLASEASLRRNWAARALIAGPLSRICAVELDLRKKLFIERGQIITGSVFTKIVWESVSSREIDLLARCIEDAVPRAAADLSALLSELQIQQARLESTVSIRREDGVIVTRHSLEDLALDSVFIVARAQRLFLYSRRDDEEYFKKPIREEVYKPCAFGVMEFNLNDAATNQLDNADDKWLAPIDQRSPRLE